tara:strand:- start:1544 stop:2113 length:570 start_codon:yes stop_codon:yes gene_type:complete
MKPHEINKQDYFIKGWYINHEDCDKVIEYYNKHPELKKPGVTDVGKDPLKKSTDIEVHCEQIEIITYSLALRECINEYKKLFPTLDENVATWGMVENMCIQKYKKNQGYLKWHTENSNLSSAYRNLVFMTYLNDVNSQGETEWFHQKVKIKPKKGLTVIWPSDWTHLHKGCVADKEEKIIITGWYGYTQ